MYFITLALFALVARSLATPTRSVLSYESNGINNTNSNTMTAPRTSTHVASSPQVTPNVAASKIIGGRTTLAPVPDQCTDSFIPYQTMFWVNSSQMNLEDAISPSWWAPISPSNWTFSTNTSGIWFSKPSWIVDGKNPALDLKPRTAANSFTLTMDQSGKVHLYCRLV